MARTAAESVNAYAVGSNNVLPRKPRMLLSFWGCPTELKLYDDVTESCRFESGNASKLARKFRRFWKLVGRMPSSSR